MQGINEMGVTQNDFLTADQLRDITATEQDLFERQVFNTKRNIMDTLVKLANEQGQTQYGVQFNKNNSPDEFIDAIVNDFTELGYSITTEDSVSNLGETEIPVKLVTLSWAQ